MEYGKCALDIINTVHDMDQPILDLLSDRYEGFTVIQISDKLCRSRNSVKNSVHRLITSGHIKDSGRYGRVHLVNYDFTPELVNKRPDEYSAKLKQLERDNERLTEIAAQKATRCDELYEALERVREVLLTQDHPLLVIESQRIEAVLQQKKFCMTCDGTGEIEDTEDNVWPCYECREEETKK